MLSTQVIEPLSHGDGRGHNRQDAEACLCDGPDISTQAVWCGGVRTVSPSCCAMQCKMASLSGHQGYDSVAAVAIWIGVSACAASQPNFGST